LAGRCETRQELADTPLDLCAVLAMLPCRGNPAFLNLVFEPLGYEVEYDAGLLDEQFPGWGQSRYGYNEIYFGSESGAPLRKPRLRHGDHRFEWTRKQFRAWAEETAEKYGYRVRFEELGDRDEERGAPTQMGVFTKCE
jgi:hypothetical protein